MRKLGFVFLALFVCGLYAAQTVGVSGAPGYAPADVKVVKLHTENTAASLDTFATTDIKTYGPYPLSPANGPMYKGFQFASAIITGTTPTAAFDYTLCSGLTLGDTSGVWTTVDTLAATAQTKYVDLSSVSAAAIVFRVNNYDGTATQIPGEVSVTFKGNQTYSYDR